jgi:hypothetical protein
MKVKLAVAIAALFFATLAHADSISTPDGTLVIPDGSVITGTFVIPAGEFGPAPAYGVDFQFQDGSGVAYGEGNDGDVGSLTFTVPVTFLSVTWIATGPADLSVGGTVAGGGYISTDCSCTTGPLVETFSGSITSLSWGNYYGYSGIESMSYIEDPPVNAPEPSSFPLSVIGLAALLLVARKLPQAANGLATR